MKSTASPARSPSPGGSSSLSIQGKDAKIEDGKLFQYVTVNWKDGPSYEAVISAIGSEAIWVRKIGDNAKVCMYVTRLVKDGDGEDCRYDLYNYEYQFNTGGANSSCGKVIQINGQAGAAWSRWRKLSRPSTGTKAAQGWTSSPNHKHLNAGH